MQPNLQEAGEDNPGEPEAAEFGEDADEPETDVVGAEIWYSTAETLEDAFDQLDPGECTFAHLGDDISMPRQCKAADGSMVPPPPGRLFYPAGVAADGTTIYVVDRHNHRITTMRYDGTAFDIAHPIGHGVPGDGTYGLPGDEFAYPSGVNGSQLHAPNAVAVDAAHRILVADGGNGRVAIFNANGTPAFASHIQVPPGIDGSDEVTPTSIAISPGAVVQEPGTTPSGAAANHRIVVADRFTCAIHIYDTAFQHLRTLPETMPAAAGEGACLAEESTAAPLGQFSLIGGVAVNRDGNIFVTDPWNNRVVVFSRDGDPIGQFGDPGTIVPGVEPPVDTLRTPSAIIVDSRDRVVIADTDKVRLAVFAVEVSDTVTAAFQFEVATSGDDVEGVPTGIAEQRGPAPDLDPAGRYLRVDTGNHQIQRYELADLAIVRQAVSYSTNTTGSGVFSVAVPVEKTEAVLAVTAEVEPPPGVTVSNFRALPPFDPNPLVPVDIPRGTWVQYAFDFEVPIPRMAAEFTITAAGNKASGQATEADPATLLVRGACTDCDAEAAVYDHPAPDDGAPVAATVYTTATGDWYSRQVFVRLEPVDGSSPVQAIEWFVSGTELPVYGTRTRVAAITEDAAYVDVPFSTPDSRITYRAVTEANTVGPERTLDLKIDFDGPVIAFNFFHGSTNTFLTTPSGFNPADGPAGSWWWRDNVTATYRATDAHSGTDTPDGTVVVSGEGRNLSAPATAVDRVGHSSTTYSNDIGSGGYPVNIDRTGPVITAPADLVLVADVSGSATVPASFIGGATAVDPLSGVQGSVTAHGPATVARGESVEWTFTATDWAGNTTTVTRTVTALSSMLVYSGATTTSHGSNLAVAAALQPSTAAGSIRFTLLDPVRGNREVSAPLAGGAAAAVLPGVLANVGTYQLRVDYVGTDVPAVSTTAAITIVKAPISIDVTPGQRKQYGEADPPLTYALNYPPYHPDDVVSATLSRVDGESAGQYDITLGSLQVSPNYEVTFWSQKFTIEPRPITVRANDTVKALGMADPAFGVTVVVGTVMPGDQFSGALTRAPGEALGDYAIHNLPPQGTLTLGPNYQLTVLPGTLSILTILPGNDPPTAADDLASGAGAAPIDIAVLANDTDPNGDALIITSVTQPSGGSAVGVVTLSGTMVKFSPAPGFVGDATFSYTVTDGKGGHDTASVTVTITPAACTPGVISLHANGNHTAGNAGNIRTFSGAGVQLKASAWSRTKATQGSWARAFLGAFGSAGLGVTDTTEGSGRDDKHKVDNVGQRLNFVLFEFSKAVTVSRALLTYVGSDSDLTVWIGTRPDPFTNHLTMSDALLASLGAPLTSQASNGSDRWAAFNAAGLSGNVLVIAADVTDTTPDDEFKIARLEVTCAAPNQPPTLSAVAPQQHVEGAAVSVPIEGADPDDDALTYAATGLPPGLAIDRATGVITGSLGYTSAGSYTVTVTVTDERDATASTTFAWTVVNRNRPPAAANDSLKTSKNTAKTMSVIANDSDPDGDAITLHSVSTPPGFKGTAIKYANGTIKYTPPKNFTGTTAFTYTIKDEAGASATATVSVTVGSHRDDDDCDRDHDHDGDRDRDDDRERDCDRDHRHDRDCDRDRDHDHDRDCDREHQRSRRCNDNAGWYNWRYR